MSRPCFEVEPAASWRAAAANLGDNVFFRDFQERPFPTATRFRFRSLRVKRGGGKDLRGLVGGNRDDRRGHCGQAGLPADLAGRSGGRRDPRRWPSQGSIGAAMTWNWIIVRKRRQGGRSSIRGIAGPASGKKNNSSSWTGKCAAVRAALALGKNSMRRLFCCRNQRSVVSGTGRRGENRPKTARCPFAYSRLPTEALAAPPNPV